MSYTKNGHQWFERQGIVPMAQSSHGKNPIEHLWETLGKAVENKKINKKWQLYPKLWQGWGKVAPSRWTSSEVSELTEKLQRLVDSMPNRIKAITDAKEDYLHIKTNVYCEIYHKPLCVEVSLPLR